MNRRLSRPLAKLIDLGYLEKDIPFGASQKDNKKSLYRIADPFLSFHYKFVPANRSFIELGRKAVIEEQLDRRLPEFIGECKWTSSENGRLLTAELRKIAEALPFTKGKQIDIVLFTKTRPCEDAGNSILPQEVIDLCA